MSTEPDRTVITAVTGFRDAARITLRSAFRKMMKNAAGTRSGLRRREPTASEVEALHDMRVGSRRLRAALSVFARVFPRGDYRELEQDITAITRALATVRDLDVQRDSLVQITASLPKNEVYGIGRLQKRLAKQRDTEREALIKALSRLNKSRFKKRFTQALDKATIPQGKDS